MSNYEEKFGQPDLPEETPGQPDLLIAGEPHYTRQALAVALGKSVQTLAGWSVRNFGPRRRRIGRTVAYSVSEVRRWLLTTTVSMDS